MFLCEQYIVFKWCSNILFCAQIYLKKHQDTNLCLLNWQFTVSKFTEFMWNESLELCSIIFVFYSGKKKKKNSCWWVLKSWVYGEVVKYEFCISAVFTKISELFCQHKNSICDIWMRMNQRKNRYPKVFWIMYIVYQ